MAANPVNWFDSLDRRLLDWLWRADRPVAGPLHYLHLFLQVSYLGLRNTWLDRVPFQANALTFITLLGLVPALALSFSLAKALGFADSLRKILFNEYTLSQREVLEYILNYVDRTHVATLGVVGLALLILSLVMTLASVEETFNRIWEVRAGRSLFRKFTDYLFVLLVCPLLVVAATAWWAGVSSNQFVRWILDMAYVGEVAGLGLQLGPFVMLVAAFIFLYLFIPNTRVPLVSAILAGFIAAFLWWVVQNMYIRFQVGVARYNAIYGGFASLPLFMIWVQVSWQVVLLGAELTRAHHVCQHGPLPAGLFPPLNSYQRQRLAFKLMYTLGRRFHNGEPPLTLDELAAALGVPNRELRQVAEDLETAGLAGDPGGQGYLQPARDLSAISLAQVLGAVSTKADLTAGDRPGEEVLNEVLGSLLAAQQGVLGEATLLDLVRSDGFRPADARAGRENPPPGEDAALPA
ncbi:MAG: YihY family inner membrane protein [Deltaproteobacteria bacterium]|nr:YihY family inner membrane protein [Deltaproteobacteria bacterium]